MQKCDQQQYAQKQPGSRRRRQSPETLLWRSAKIIQESRRQTIRRCNQQKSPLESTQIRRWLIRWRSGGQTEDQLLRTTETRSDPREGRTKGDQGGAAVAAQKGANGQAEDPDEEDAQGPADDGRPDGVAVAADPEELPEVGGENRAFFFIINKNDTVWKYTLEAQVFW